MWPIALLFATFQVSSPHSSTSMDVLALTVYAAGSVVCHQLPQRSFRLWSTQMPVCARCAGIYAGAAVAVVVLMFGRAAESLRNSRFESGGHAVRRALVVAALPTVVTLVAEWSGSVTTSNWVRAVAGVPLGGAVAWAIGSAVASREVN